MLTTNACDVRNKSILNSIIPHGQYGTNAKPENPLVSLLKSILFQKHTKQVCK